MESRGIFHSSNITGKRINSRESVINNDDKKKSTKARKKSSKNNDISNDISNDELNFESNATIIISIVENRAREICISKLSTIDMSKIELYLIQDNHGYQETMTLINDLQPNEILLHDGSKQRIIAKKIEEHSKHEDIRILYISRQYFDQDRGADMLKKVIVGNVDRDLIAKYTVLAGTYCLLRYIENCQNITFPNHSLRIEYASSMTGRCNIDRRTSLNLELINNTKNGSQKESLFGVINYTRTIVGARLLKTNILRPSTDILTIETRLDTVELLLSSNTVFTDIIDILTKFPDLDKMLIGLTSIPTKITKTSARTSIDTLIFLKEVLLISPSLANTMKRLIPNEFISNTPQRGNINSKSTKYSKSPHEMRHEECFALKPGINGLLDVARKTYLQSVEDIYSLCETYSIELQSPVKVVYNSSRGYYVTISNDINPIPPGFIQAVLNSKTISCTTEEIASLSDRAIEAIDNALTITNELIQSLMEKIRIDMDYLFNLVDSIALLDMLTSFADLVALCPHPYTRPIITDDGPLVIKSGRHCIISKLGRQQLFSSSFVANDTFLSPLENFQIITGSNGSGKTVFIKQVALIVILSQIGCFVPCQHATIPIRDRILSRLGTFDDLEHNLSTFLTEMRETSYLINNLTPRSLVIIDELGRGTSNIDGVSIAFAVAESLIFTPAYTLFVTHYTQLTSLPSLYSNAKNAHFKTSINVSSSNSSDSLVYMYQLDVGPCDIISGYGIMMAERCCFPTNLIIEARNIQKIVRSTCPLLLPCETANSNEILMTNLIKKLLLLKNSSLNDTSLRNYLQNLRSKLTITEINEIERLIIENINNNIDIHIDTVNENIFIENSITNQYEIKDNKSNSSISSSSSSRSSSSSSSSDTNSKSINTSNIIISSQLNEQHNLVMDMENENNQLIVFDNERNKINSNNNNNNNNNFDIVNDAKKKKYSID